MYKSKKNLEINNIVNKKKDVINMEIREEQERKRLEKLRNSGTYSREDVRKRYSDVANKNVVQLSGFRKNKKDSFSLIVKKAAVRTALVGIVPVSACGVVSILGTRNIVDNVVASGVINENVYSENDSDGIYIYEDGSYEAIDTDWYLREKAKEIMDKGFTADDAYITFIDKYGASADIDGTNTFSRAIAKVTAGAEYIDNFIDYAKDFDNNRGGR